MGTTPDPAFVTNAKTGTIVTVSASSTPWYTNTTTFASWSGYGIAVPDLITNPFDGFDASKKRPTQQEIEETSEQIEKKLTDIGKRKISMG